MYIFATKLNDVLIKNFVEFVWDGIVRVTNAYTVMLQIYNKEGMWIKLDKEAMKRFELKQYDSVWSLAVDKSQIIYLRSDFSINKGKFS